MVNENRDGRNGERGLAVVDEHIDGIGRRGAGGVVNVAVVCGYDFLVARGGEGIGQHGRSSGIERGRANAGAGVCESNSARRYAAQARNRSGDGSRLQGIELGRSY